MINNRQNGRRRGRGGGGGGGGGPRQGGQGQRDSGNRIDSRARGNAAQLLEKYKNMARDAQLSSDRVNTEYYLQFADHYFRVLADQRGRSDDQQGQGQQRRQHNDFDPFDLDDDFGDENETVRADEQPRNDRGGDRDRDGRDGEDRQREQRARDDRPRDDRQRDDRPRDDRQRDDRPRDDRPREDRYRDERRDRRPQPSIAPANDLDTEVAAAEVAPAIAGEDEQPRRRRGRKPREAVEANGADEATGAAHGIDADRLPPALGAKAAMEGVPGVEGELATEEAPRPRRRRARVAGEVNQAG